MTGIGNFIAWRRPVANPIVALGDDLGEWFSALDLTKMFTDTAGTVAASGPGDVIATIRAQNDPTKVMTQTNAAKRGTYQEGVFNNNTTAGIVMDLDDGAFYQAGSAYVPNASFFGVAMSLSSGEGSTLFAHVTADRNAVFYVRNATYLDGFQGSYNGVALNASAYNDDNLITNDTPYTVFIEHDGTNLNIYVGQGDADPVLASSVATAIDSRLYESVASIFAEDSGSNAQGGCWQHFVRYSRRDLTTAKRRALNDYFRSQRGSITYTLAIKETMQIGSMTAGSNVVTGLADTSGFEVGDPVVMEPNTGYNTSGPGGIFPAQSAANEATILALPGPVSGAIYAEDTHKVYDTYGGGAGYALWWPEGFYTNKTIPLPLVARVVSKTSTTLTLDQNAVSSVTSSKIFFDIGPALQAMNGPDGSTYIIPAGDYSLSEGAIHFNRRRWTVKGAGRTATTLRNVRGGQPTFLRYNFCVEPTTRDFNLVGNHAWDGSTSFIRLDANQVDVGGWGISHWNCYDPWVYRVDWHNINVSGIDTHACEQGTRQFTEGTTPFQTEDGRQLAGLIQECAGSADLADQRYINWQINTVDNLYRVEMRDCSWASPYLKKVWESFRSEGSIYTRFTGVNCLGSCNSAAGSELIEPNILIEANCRDRTVVAPIAGDVYLISLNNNIGDQSGSSAGSGGKIVNPTLVQEGWLDSGGTIARAINIYQQPGWDITGTYDPTVSDDGLRKGLISAPAPKAGRDTTLPMDQGSVDGPAIIVDSQQTHISGIRFEFITVPGMQSIPAGAGIHSIHTFTAIPNTSAVNTISGTSSTDISSGIAVQTGNVSNAAYAAL